ncbi:MAG: hypothetical protein IJA85_02150 [Clostridia bacterium]|nr:hypothetical protein [Clostridia bacterium]
MITCTFFGHRDTPKKIEPILRSTLMDLIENKHVELFFVGNQGSFDALVRRNLKLMAFEYPHITYAVVLAYMPTDIKESDCEDYGDTIFPEGLEHTPPKYAIDKRNRWMLDNADYVLTYVTRSGGGAAKWMELAENKGKNVINLADIAPQNTNCTSSI